MLRIEFYFYYFELNYLLLKFKRLNLWWFGSDLWIPFVNWSILLKYSEIFRKLSHLDLWSTTRIVWSFFQFQKNFLSLQIHNFSYRSEFPASHISDTRVNNRHDKKTVATAVDFFYVCFQAIVIMPFLIQNWSNSNLTCYLALKIFYYSFIR